MVKALPDGGKCMGFVGYLGADNARERIEGFRKAVEGSKVELVDVRGDDVDFAKARSNVDDVLAANPEITCMVGFYSYNPPKIYEALQAAGKLGQITVVAFDEDPVTLGAVKEGSFASTVVQQPFEWGYQGMKLMAAYLGGDKSDDPRRTSSSSCRPRSSTRRTSTPSPRTSRPRSPAPADGGTGTARGRRHARRPFACAPEA